MSSRWCWGWYLWGQALLMHPRLGALPATWWAGLLVTPPPAGLLRRYTGDASDPKALYAFVMAKMPDLTTQITNEMTMTAFSQISASNDDDQPTGQVWGRPAPLHGRP